MRRRRKKLSCIILCKAATDRKQKLILATRVMMFLLEQNSITHKFSQKALVICNAKMKKKKKRTKLIKNKKNISIFEL